MKNLNDKIEINIVLRKPFTKATYLNFVLAERTSRKSLYYGRVWFDKGEISKSVYFSDIFEGLKDIDWYSFETIDNNFDTKTNFKYSLQTQIFDTGWEDLIADDIIADVYLIHPQRMIRSIEDCLENDYANIYPMLSGLKYHTVNDNTIVEPELLPLIPEGYKDEIYGYLLGAQMDITNTNISYGTLTDVFVESDVVNIPDIKGNQVANVISIPNEFSKGDTIAIAYNNTDITDENYDTIVKLAKIDCSDSRYYLSWFDRCGGIQMQPFNRNYRRSTDYTTIEKVNKYGENENISIQTNDSIELNTNWIDEKLLPYYEAMFVSPYVCLWDNELKESYKAVIREKNFEYKTFHNQGRQMFNLKITVEISNKENILY